MSKSGLLIIFIVLLLVLGGVGWYAKMDVMDFQNVFAKKTLEVTPTLVNDRSVILPVGLDNPNVGSVRAHYFMAGTIKEVKSLPDGYEIVLANSKYLPKIVVNNGVRVSKITPPYNSAAPVPFPAKDLKPGMVIDISLEYELASEVWIIQDVFVPTDKNK